MAKSIRALIEERSGENFDLHERYLNTPGLNRQFLDETWHARSYRRLGELYEARGDAAQAVEYYSKFVELWDNADAELQPMVEDVRGRITRLVGERQ